MPYTPSTDHYHTPAQPQRPQGSSHTPPPRAAEAPRPPGATGRCLLGRRSHSNKPDLGAAASLRASIPGEPAAGNSSGLLLGFSNVANALAAYRSTAPPLVPGRSAAAARPEGHALPARRRTAARRSADAACIEWCLQTTRPAAPEGRSSSIPGRAPKERPPDRSGRGRERRGACPRRMASANRRERSLFADVLCILRRGSTGDHFTFRG